MNSRITAFMIYNQFSKQLGRNLSNLATVQEQISSGKKLTKPSDDVIALRGSMAYKVSINAIEQYHRNINEGLSSLGLSESLLSSSRSILDRARELAVSESNDTATADTRMMSSYEVQNLFNELIDIGNSKLKDKYLFSGYLTNTQAFTSAGAYQGDSNNININISNGITSQINVTGDVAFSDTSKYLSNDLTGETLQGVLRIAAGSGNAVDLPIKDGATAATPEEIRDAVNAPMSKWYTDGTSTVGTGTLTFKVGTNNAVSIDVNAANANTTVSTLVSYINANVAGIEAGVATDSVTAQQRIFFRPTTAGTEFTIDVANDGDNDDADTNGLSALLHTDLKSSLTTTALGVEAFVINDSSSKRLLFSPTTDGTAYTILTDEGNDGSFADAADTDASGLSLLYLASSAATNMTNSISFFTVLDHFQNSLSTNDTIGVRQSLHLLDGALDSLVNTTADVGSRLKYLENQKDRLADNELSYKESLSVLEDADIAAVALEMTKIQTTLEAMRISSVQSLSQSLFDFLG